MTTPRTIVVLGKSGSGKDTQVKLLIEKLKPSLVISTGGLARTLMEKSTLMGQRVKETLKKGGLLPAWLGAFLWQEALSEKFTGDENLIFSSSPRRVDEAEELDEVMRWLERGNVEAVLVDVSDDEALARLLKRGRDDDTENNIRERLSWFKEDVVPVIDYYQQKGRLHKVNGIGKVEDIFERIKQALGLE